MTRPTRTTTHDRERRNRRGRAARQAALERRLRWTVRLGTGLVAVLAVLLVVTVLADRRGSDPVIGATTDVALPNPTGGPARVAPVATGAPVSFGGLQVEAPDTHMGDVPLNVTVVPHWIVSNPTGTDATLTVGQPRILEGCCPGPVYVDGKQIAPGSTVTVPAHDQVFVQFPLQMHPGMDGPHHLTVPLSAQGEHAQLHVTGNFTSTAT